MGQLSAISANFALELRSNYCGGRGHNITCPIEFDELQPVHNLPISPTSDTVYWSCGTRLVKPNSVAESEAYFRVLVHEVYGTLKGAWQKKVVC